MRIFPVKSAFNAAGVGAFKFGAVVLVSHLPARFILNAANSVVHVGRVPYLDQIIVHLHCIRARFVRTRLALLRFFLRLVFGGGGGGVFAFNNTEVNALQFAEHVPRLLRIEHFAMAHATFFRPKVQAGSGRADDRHRKTFHAVLEFAQCAAFELEVMHAFNKLLSGIRKIFPDIVRRAVISFSDLRGSQDALIGVIYRG